jgi:hypothetical protein
MTDINDPLQTLLTNNYIMLSTGLTALTACLFLTTCSILYLKGYKSRQYPELRRHLPVFDDDLERSLASKTTFVTLVFKLDDFPSSISWKILKNNDGQIAVSRPAGFYQNRERDVILHHIELIIGIEYTFIMTDFSAEGLGGFVKLYYGKQSNIFGNSPQNVIAHVNGFVGNTYSVKFKPRLPNPSILNGQKQIVPSPTPAPTKCLSNIDYETNKIPFKKKPIFTTTRYEFGASESICSYHTNYANCTNEIREDCQWIFLNQGRRRGKCRVDPIAKCLQKGDCVCNTEDFHGGDSRGILFHVPVSVTARDISPYSKTVSYIEQYKFPVLQNQKHPQDDSFFISKVDFTGRQLQYSFRDSNPTVTTTTKTIYFKLHYLYIDVPIIGDIWDGMGITVSIDTSSKPQVIRINGKNYKLPKKLKKWTCTQIAITPNILYVANKPIVRVLNEEIIPSVNIKSTIRLGSFTGELFDVRIYGGESSQSQILETGTRCAAPDDAATIKKYEDIESQFLRWSCSEINPLAYRQVPTGGVQTYGSGAFATLWMAPIQDPLNENKLLNIPEGSFDEEYFFQHAKLQSYQWERHYFENDMIAFVLQPYRMFSSDEIQDWAVKTFNNPCRFIHQYNNDWDFPLYSDGIIPKWTTERYVKEQGGSQDATFDLGMMYRGIEPYGYGFFTHEAFHQFHASLVEVYNAQPNGWLQESAAEFAATMLFPKGNRILASVALAPSWPLGFPDTQYNPGNSRIINNPHIFTTDVSLGDRIRGGHYYGTWIFWWFLSEQAGLPHLLGQMFSVDKSIEGYWHGKLFVLRLLLRSNDIDLGDAWSIFVAHFRTWDFKNGEALKKVERVDFEGLKSDGGLPPSITLQGRKTSVLINPTMGTGGKFIAGPLSLRPSPFSWNCLTSKGIAAKKIIGITIAWDDGMGFASDVNPPNIVQQHFGCDKDMRFFHAVAVLYNSVTKQRSYWKLKGKSPPTVFLPTGSMASVNLHILLTPTPPVDYSGGRLVRIDDFVSPLPIYSYKYKIDIMDSVPNGSSVNSSAEKEFGIVKFDRASAAPWFSSKCSCLDNPNDLASGNLCLLPTFRDTNPIPVSHPSSATTPGRTKLPPTAVPIGKTPNLSPKKSPTTYPPRPRPTKKTRTLFPTSIPVKKPRTLSPTSIPIKKPRTLSPTSIPIKKPRTLSPTLIPIKKPRTRFPVLLTTTTKFPAVMPTMGVGTKPSLQSSQVPKLPNRTFSQKVSTKSHIKGESSSFLVWFQRSRPNAD